MRVALIFLLFPLPIYALIFPSYTVHSFTFPHIPFHIALKHIHTPEKCVEVYALLPEGFHITKTFAPTRKENYDAVEFRFATSLTDHHYATLFTDCAHCSQLLLMDRFGKPYLLVCYSVRQYVPPTKCSAFEGGHTLMVTSSRLQEESFLYSLCFRRPVVRENVRAAIQAFGNRNRKEDPNLKEYRRRVLKLG